MGRGWRWSGLKIMTGLSTPMLAALLFGTVIVVGLLVVATAYFAISGGYKFPNIGRTPTIAVATLFLLALLLLAILGRRITFNK